MQKYDPKIELEQERKSLTTNLIILIIIIAVAIILLYYQTFLGKAYKIFGVIAGLLFFASIYQIFGRTLFRMESYEREKRILEPEKLVPRNVVIRNYIIFAVICTLIAAAIIVLSYF